MNRKKKLNDTEKTLLVDDFKLQLKKQMEEAWATPGCIRAGAKAKWRYMIYRGKVGITDTR